MNRNNIWIHVGIATVLITLAAVLGQIDRWRSALTTPVSETRVVRTVAFEKRSAAPEVLVRFKPGITLDRVRAIAAGNNDLLADNIESVKGLTVIDDLDDADAQGVADQYAAMADHVEYADVNYEIKLDDPIEKQNTRKAVYLDISGPQPNDPHFAEQWALNNLGNNGGKERADLDALEAWLTTQGSEDVVVAVLDSGVDYTHVDLRANMWFRPENIPVYVDE
ncbi:MAG: hypothetical protein LC734_11570, partial [Acidobacteria bacterium]|nr:hypothetical protein [Acidobacteriota bacterium]